MDWGSIVGANVRRFRRERGLTQERLAFNADIDLRYLGGVERGEHNPSVEMLARLATALAVHPREFFDEELGGGQEGEMPAEQSTD